MSEVFFIPKDQPDPYDQLLSRAVQVFGKELGEKHADRIWDRVDNKGDNELTEQEAMVELEKLIAERKRRGRILVSHEVHTPEGERLVSQRGVHMQEILNSRDPDLFIGNGASADVYIYRGLDKVCVKFHEREFTLNHSVQKEAGIMKQLVDLNVEGARVPTPYFTVSNFQVRALVMERLDAVDASLVVQGVQELPASFDIDEFARKLKAFVFAMHERSIFHLDIDTRNVMIDRETGDPRLIDFGKGATRMDVMGEDGYKLDPLYRSRDLGGVELVVGKLRGFLSKNKAK